ncbi:hypothetical protein [Parvularcula sp. IMCC14364]|uniref:hypothetical protein n=1 Tax=Parvularcula sp. IMCC14364 TaxID=3067902 RepID=UPI002740B44A|nr:hypothetical protein [Parvularcula sp. IMCC14364]
MTDLLVYALPIVACLFLSINVGYATAKFQSSEGQPSLYQVSTLLSATFTLIAIPILSYSSSIMAFEKLANYALHDTYYVVIDFRALAVGSFISLSGFIFGFKTHKPKASIYERDS